MIRAESLLELAEKMPKVELHLHIEGTLEPEQMFEMAHRNNVVLRYCSIEEIKAAYQFENLQSFLDLYYQGMSVLQTEQDFHELTMAYLKRVHEDNVVHVEIFFDPQGHLERGVAFATQINGIHAALEDAERNLGITSKLIMSFLRHLDENSAFKTLELAKPFSSWIDGVGLDSSEVGNPPSKFANVFRECRALGLKVTAHAGEEGPPEYVWQALDVLHVDRIDHGNRALEDSDLIAEIKHQGLTLTVCPLSNLKLRVVDSLEHHPIQAMLRYGLNATVNSDDPAYFGGYMSDNYRALIMHTKLTHQDLYRLAQNAFIGSWMSSERRVNYLKELELMFACVKG